MTNSQPSNWTIFRLLCRVLGGQDQLALTECTDSQFELEIYDLAEQLDLLPALAVRCGQERVFNSGLRDLRAEALTEALRENTMRNMQISAQVLKFTRQLNTAGILPLFLKGTIQLLDPNTKNLGFRKQVDIDLLVEPDQISAAAEVFLKDGYGFYEFTADHSSPPKLLPNTSTAIHRSAHHHHLPPLVKSGCPTSVELHRHFLPKRFQSKNPLDPLFSTAIQQERHSAKFLTPSTEYQLIHLILGKMVHDGHFARCTFPVREACDYIYILESAEGKVDFRCVEKHCGNRNAIFSQLVAELMTFTPEAPHNTHHQIERRLKVMQRRYNSRAMGTMLNGYARSLHLTQSFAHSPAKLPNYLRRLSKS